jgi:hypothetical protein
MTLLQVFSDEVTVSSLPHPISMFFVGITLMVTLFLFLEYKRTKEDFKFLKNNFLELEKTLREVNSRAEEKIAELSKKLDSRIDKAILSLKKDLHEK